MFKKSQMSKYFINHNKRKKNILNASHIRKLVLYNFYLQPS